MIRLPQRRAPSEQVLAAMKALREHDAKWREGKTWSLVYHAGDDVTELLQEAYPDAQ
jgi:sphinganine-1-phosphate aldolase